MSTRWYKSVQALLQFSMLYSSICYMMGLLRKVCKRVLKGLSKRKRVCKDAVSNTSHGVESMHRATSTASVKSCTSLQSLELSSVKPTAHGDSTGTCCRSSEYYASFIHEPTVVNVTRFPSQGCESETMAAAVAGTRAENEPTSVRNLSSESDSGVCLGEESDELVNDELDDSASEWSDEEEECECEECAFSRCEYILQDWHVSAKDLALDKVLSSQQEELVYSGYWHGSVTVHQRQSKRQSVLNFYIREAHMLSKIRHENVQLFLGVCLDLRPDSVALVMSDIKGDSLHSLVHKKGQEFQFAALTKYINQIAQGMAYLHDRGIAHPLLASSCISIHYRVCISMLSPAFCSNSVEPSQLIYLPPEVIRTLHHSPTHHRRNTTLLTDPTNQDSTDANIFSFGTIVYEMVNMSRPFPTTPGELIIWEVGSNRHQSLHHMNNGKFKDIIQKCWSPEPDLRPSFKELLCKLEQNMSPRACGLNAYFSFSDPGRLAKTGLY